MSILTKMIEVQVAVQAVVVAQEAAKEAARAQIVDRLHTAFAPYADEVAAMCLRSDYGGPVKQGDAQARLYRGYATKSGVDVSLGSKINRRWLRLAVDIHKNGLMRVLLSRCGDNSNSGEVIEVFDIPHACSADTMVEALLHQLVLHVWTEKRVPQ